MANSGEDVMDSQTIVHNQKSANKVVAATSIFPTHLMILVIVVAVILRLASALYQGNQVEALPGIYDQLSYDGLAQRVVSGHGFSFEEGHWPATRAGEPTAHWSYLYTLYLSAVYALFGHQPLVARIVQALVAGVLQTWLTWRIGRRIFGPAAGLFAAALSAIYIYFFYYGGSLLTEPFYFVGILWTIDTALRIVDRDDSGYAQKNGRKRWWKWLELGLAIGVTVLLRQLFLLFVPVLFLWIWWNLQPAGDRRYDKGQVFRWETIRGLAAATLVVTLLIIPWTIRNYLAFDTLVPLNTNAGYAFFWGNHPIHGTHFIPLLGNAEYYELIPDELLPLNEAEIDQALLREGLGFVSDQPLRFLLLSMSRAEEYFKFWPTVKSGVISNLSRVASFGITLPFMLYGLWLSVKLLRQPQSAAQPMQILLLYLFIVVYAGIHLLSWALIRYRLPIDAVLMVFAGLALSNLLKRAGLGDDFQAHNPG